MTDLDKEFVKAGRIRLTDHSVSAKVTVQTVTKKITNKHEWKPQRLGTLSPVEKRRANRKDECNGSDRHHERKF